MANIRKWIKINNATLLDGTDFDGIRTVGMAFERTLCKCGFYSASPVYECPECGNTKFLVCRDYQTELSVSDPEVVVNKKKNEVKVVRKRRVVFLKQEIEIGEVEDTQFTYDGNVASMANRWHGGQEIISLLYEHRDELPDEMKDNLELLNKLGLLTETNIFTKIFGAYPNLRRLILNEEDRNPAFVAAILKKQFNSYYGGDKDIEFDSVEKYFKEFAIPAEFQPLALSHCEEFFRRTLDVRNGWRANPHAKFEVPANWNLVPDELKGVVMYYLENRVINLHTYFNLGQIPAEMLKKYPAIVSLFFKKYMMYYKDGIINGTISVYNFLQENGEAISADTFDVRHMYQIQNMNDLYANLARSKTDIDNFINSLEGDAVAGLKALADAKRTKKASS